LHFFWYFQEAGPAVFSEFVWKQLTNFSAVAGWVLKGKLAAFLLRNADGFNLWYEDMRELADKKIVSLQLSEGTAMAVSNAGGLGAKSYGSSAAFHFYNWLGLGVFIARIYFSFTYAWWSFLPGFFIWRVIWKANKKGNIENQVADGYRDRDFYELVNGYSGWAFLIEEDRAFEAFVKATFTVKLAEEIASDDYEPENLFEVTKLVRICGHELRASDSGFEIESGAGVLDLEETDESGVIDQVKRLYAVPVSRGTYKPFDFSLVQDPLSIKFS
jgi:hypothetical protein